MSDIFVSHAEEDAELAAQVAAGLEDAGYTTWHYRRDSLPGVPFVRQIPEVIDVAQAVVLVISTDSLDSPHVDREVFEAYRGGKRLVPLLTGLTHFQFRERKRDWALMLGAAVFVPVPADGISATVPRIVAGLRQMGVVPSGAATSPPRDAPRTPPARDPVPTPRVVPAPEPAFLPNLRPTSGPETGPADGRTARRESGRRVAPGGTESRVGEPPWQARPQAAPDRTPPRRVSREVATDRTDAAGFGRPIRRHPLRVWSWRILRTGLVAVALLTGLLVWESVGDFRTPTPTHVRTATSVSSPDMISAWRLETSGQGRNGDGPDGEIQGQALIVTIPSGSYYDASAPPSAMQTEHSPLGEVVGAGLVSSCKLVGDFDIQVAFELVNWPLFSGVRVGLATKANDGDQSVERASWSAEEVPPSGAEVFVFAFKPGASSTISKHTDRGTKGSLRLTRTGSAMHAYVVANGSRTKFDEYSDGNWIGGTEVYLKAWSHDEILDVDAGQTVEVHFSNFQVVKGTWRCD